VPHDRCMESTSTHDSSGGVQNLLDDTQALPAALGRVLPRIGGVHFIEQLAALSGSDFTTVMLEVAKRRAARETPGSVLRRYSSDRFVRPSTIEWRSLRRAEDALLGCLPDDVDVLTLAPLVPLASHSALGTVSQHKVVTTIRACEVAADPTNALALEAASRRARDRGLAGTVRLAGVQRVVRAQQVPAGMYPHFSLFARVTAGRDEGSCRFEQAALAEHLGFAITALTAVGAVGVEVALTPLSDAGPRIADAVTAELADQADQAATILMDHTRQAGRGYYRDVCFKVNINDGGKTAEIGDGGFTNWTAKLLANQKERLLISGYGLDRLSHIQPAHLLSRCLAMPAHEAGRTVCRDRGGSCDH
jgi:hypothetical protein